MLRCVPALTQTSAGCPAFHLRAYSALLVKLWSIRVSRLVQSSNGDSMIRFEEPDFVPFVWCCGPYLVSVRRDACVTAHFCAKHISGQRPLVRVERSSTVAHQIECPQRSLADFHDLMLSSMRTPTLTSVSGFDDALRLPLTRSHDPVSQDTPWSLPGDLTMTSLTSQLHSSLVHPVFIVTNESLESEYEALVRQLGFGAVVAVDEEAEIASNNYYYLLGTLMDGIEVC